MDEPESILALTLFFGFLIILFILSAFFAAAETALIGLSPAKSRSFVSKKKRGANAVAFFKDHPEKLLITIMIGNNLANTIIPVLSTVIFIKIFGNEILGILTGILTILILIFGEIVPKAFAQKHTEGFSLFAAPILYFLEKILFPIVFLLEKLLKALGSKKVEKTFSDEELLALAEIGEEEGHLDAEERERIEGVLEMDETTAGEVMTPRMEMDTLPETTSLQNAVKFFLEKTHSRIPVFSESIDHITSILTLKNILHFDQKYDDDALLSSFPKNPPLIIPMAMRLTEVLKKMKWKKTHMAIVVDEHGATSGLITLEDILEEVFGDIEDETDREVEDVRKLKKNVFLVRGNAQLEEISEKIGESLEGEESDTLAKVILEKIGRFPSRGEEIVLQKDIFAIVEKMDGHRIDSVRLLLKK